MPSEIIEFHMFFEGVCDFSTESIKDFCFHIIKKYGPKNVFLLFHSTALKFYFKYSFERRENELTLLFLLFIHEIM